MDTFALRLLCMYVLDFSQLKKKLHSETESNKLSKYLLQEQVLVQPGQAEAAIQVSPGCLVWFYYGLTNFICLN